MAGLYTRCNLFLGGKNKIRGASTKGNSTFSPSLVVFYTPIFTLTQAFGYTFFFTFVLGLLERYTDKNLLTTIKLALEYFIKGQEHGQLQASSAPCKHSLKTWFPDLYYKNLYLNCYWFCQQYKNFFKTTRANKPNQVFFAALFLCRAMV